MEVDGGEWRWLEEAGGGWRRMEVDECATANMACATLLKGLDILPKISIDVLMTIHEQSISSGK